ncbi:MAG: PEP-CTERM sorting domain-containing protein [Cyanobacteria bacterium P01_F01_bin.53]
MQAEEGNYFAELNAHIDGTLFQDVSGVDAGQQMGFSFLHRARRGTDVMNLAITDLGLDNEFGTADDTVLFTKDYAATTAQWETNTSEGEETIMTLGNDIRFAYSAVSTGSGNNSIGNFIDEAKFGLAANVTPDAVAKDVPEPASILALLAFGGLSVGGALRKKQAA